jgi:hypothetical protein
VNVWRIARLVAAKDLRVEWRSRVMTNQVLPFAALVMVMFAFALDSDQVLTRVAPGLVWLATMFSVLVVVQRSFAVETADGALDALQVAGVRPGGIFLGKSLALAAQLAVLELVLAGRGGGALQDRATGQRHRALGHDVVGRDHRAGIRRYALRRSRCRGQRARNAVAAPHAPGGGASSHRCNSGDRGSTWYQRRTTE